ncbi:MAG: polyhydroxyalkanoate synthesis regulator DNA-binding domain-containing protein [Terriglobales bacterium]
MKRKTVVIKKYGNRRLYDTTNSEYINQDEVAQMIRDGQDVQVVDAATGEDLTRLVLTQIIVQNAKEPDSVFPVDILRQMVAAGGKATQETTLKYMKAVLDMYQNAYRAIAPPVSPFEFMQSAARHAPPEPWGPQAGMSHDAGSAQQKNDDTEDVDELKRRVEKLTSMVDQLASKKTARKRKRKS